MLLRNTILPLCLLALGACSTPPQKPVTVPHGDYGYTRQYISWLIGQEMKDADVTGLSIALVDDQRIVWAQGFGYADKQADIAATPDTVYHLGSIAKVFTATAAMQLAEQGKLDIDRPLQQYLPEFSIKSRTGDTGKITPRNIMTHHSGLPCNWVHGMSERHPGPFTGLVTAVRDEYTAFPPDYVFAYSNLGVTLLGTAIERVSGQPYADYMTEHLLGPLGMTHSEFAARAPGKSYNRGKEIEVIPLRDLPSGGLNSSAADIARFMQMVFADGKYNGRQIVKPETMQEMFRVQSNLPLDFDFKMGLGWMLSGMDVPGATAVPNHGGTTLNYHTMLAVLPEHKLGVVVLANSTTAQSMVGKIAAETLRLALEAKRGIAPPAKQLPEQKQEVPLTLDDVSAYTGYFDTLIGLVKVKGNSDELVAEIMGQQLELVPREGKQFGVRFQLFGFIPVRIGVLEELNLSLHRIDGRDVLALKSNEQAMLVGMKLEPAAIPAQLLDYVGEYEIVNKHDGPMPDSVRVLHEDGLLITAITFPQKPGFVYRTALRPVSANEALMDGIGPGKDETLHLKKVGDEVTISFSGFEMRKKPRS